MKKILHSTRNEYYNILDTKKAQQISNENSNYSEEKAPNSCRNHISNNKKYFFEQEGMTTNGSTFNHYLNFRARIPPQPMFKSTVYKYGIIKHVPGSLERLHSQSFRHQRKLIINPREVISDKQIRYPRQLQKKIKYDKSSPKDEPLLNRNEINYLQNSQNEIMPLVNQNIHKIMGKNNKQIISYAKREESTARCETSNEIDDDVSDIVFFRSRKRF